MFDFKFGKDDVWSRIEYKKYWSANYCVVNTFLKRVDPTCVNNNIHCQETDVCGEKILSEFNILKQFYSSGVRNLRENTTGK